MSDQEAWAQKVPREQAVIGTTVTVAPNPRYESDGLGRLIFGTEYRSIWATPVEIPVLDIGSFAGGLSPLKKGGFGQTTSLHMRGADGIRYVFRSIDKNPERGLPDNLKNTFVADVVRDQISAQHPYASLVVPGLLEPIGILHVVPTLYIMPDDPRLGDFQDDFAGLVGAIEERPNEAPDGEPGFAGADKVKSSEGMYDDLEDHGYERVNEYGFLKARLMDIFLGDRDRHFDQWRWARMDQDDGSRLWYPIPKDRDQAFKVNDGLMMWAVRIYEQQYVSFSEKYPNIEGASHNGRELDRRLLVGLEAWEWDSVATDIQASLTDSVIENAVRQLPPEIYAVDGEELTYELKSRRDHFPEMARDYYLLLAKVVDLHSSDDPDMVRVERQPNGIVHVDLRTQSGYPYFERTFYPEETDEIRILTHGGDDSLVVSGVSGPGIKIRMIPGGGDDVMIDSTSADKGGKTLWYDHRGENEVALGRNAELDDREPYRTHPDELFEPPLPEDDYARAQQTWGSYWFPVANAGYSSDLGVSVSAGFYHLRHGFRTQPYKYKWSLEGTITTSARSKIVGRLDAPDIGPGWESHVYAHWSRLQTIRFNGFGNESELEEAPGSDFYKTKSTEMTGSFFFTKHLNDQIQADFGPVFTWVNDDNDENTFTFQNADSLLGASEHLVLTGLGASLSFDTRDNQGAARSGVYLNVESRAIPKVFGADSTGGYVQLWGSGSTYLSPKGIPFRPTLALRLGGSTVTGDFPYYRAAFLGGTHNMRGIRENRYAGDFMAFGNAELRLKLLNFPLVFPWDAGIYGFYDAGRVWYDEDPSEANEIHTGWGGGVWFSVLDRIQTFRLGFAEGEGERLIYFG
ncbi:MAG: BamA/TamA family outer membrane protein, partial [Candidatus Latescibacterota bacterium]